VEPPVCRRAAPVRDGMFGCGFIQYLYF